MNKYNKNKLINVWILDKLDEIVHVGCTYFCRSSMHTFCRSNAQNCRSAAHIL